MSYKNLLFCLLFIFACLKIPKNYFRLTGGFRLSSCVLNIESAANSLPLSEETKLALDQPFFFLKRGSQAYVFVSQDKKYVLKLFAKPLKSYRFQRYTHAKKPHLHASFAPLRIENALKGYRIASALPRALTALVHEHLELTENTLPSITLYDAFYRSYQIPLDHNAFVLQKKCDLLVSTLKNLAETNNFSAIESLRQSYLETIAYRASLGIRNTDTEFKKNFGVLEGRVVEFDVGEYVLDPEFLSPEKQEEEVGRFQNHFDYWMKKHFFRAF